MRFYRVAKTDPPTRDDFLTWVEKGNRMPDRATEKERLSRTSVSVYLTAEAAEAQRAIFPKLGDYVVPLDVPEGGKISWVQTGPNKAHYDLHGGSANELLALAIATRQETR